MRNMILYAALVAGGMLAACERQETVEANVDLEANATDQMADASRAAAAGWPEGARIVEVDNVYYRIEPSGARVRLEPGDSTILVEDGVRYRLDPGGTRVRIDEEGAVVSVGPDGVDANVPVGGDARVTVNTQ